jgi:hypothetical protein
VNRLGRPTGIGNDDISEQNKELLEGTLHEVTSFSGPMDIQDYGDIVDISAGEAHTMFRSSQGRAYISGFVRDVHDTKFGYGPNHGHNPHHAAEFDARPTHIPQFGPVEKIWSGGNFIQLETQFFSGTMYHVRA